MIKCAPHVQHDYFSSFNQSDHCFLVSSLLLPSSLRKLPVFEPRTATGSENFARQDRGLSQIFKLIVSTSEKRLNNINVVV